MPRGRALRRVYARSHASATPQVSDKVTDLVTRRLGIVEPFSGAVAETRVHESCRLLDHRFDLQTFDACQDGEDNEQAEYGKYDAFFHGKTSPFKICI